MTEDQKREKARQLRYKRPVVYDLTLEAMQSDFWEMQEACEDVRWFEDDEENLIAALDGDEDEAYEFRMAFSSLCGELEQFGDDLQAEYVVDCYDDLLPAMKVRGFGGYMGYDEYEGDYFGLDPFQYDIAEGVAEKRVCRMTKKELLFACGQCLMIVRQYLAIRYRYDCLKASLDILRDKNQQILKLFREIDDLYKRADKVSSGFKYCWYDEVNQLDRLLDEVPQEYWIQ